MKTRKDDFEVRRKHLKDLSDHELKTYFYKLLDDLIDPILNIAYKQTSPSIERSVLLRMGFSSLEAKAIVDVVLDYGLIGHGAGHVVYRYAKYHQLSIREAGLKIIETSHLDEIKGGFIHDELE
ncbi:MAG: ornithine aminomutase subunit alpha [Acholeplasmataceae bacterium]|nr:ornithine aminomutase subunit alpha [Acholeplasmataceae bacterium]